MAAAAYNTDLATITTAANEQATTNWTSINGASATLGANETDQYIVDSNSFSKTAGSATSERGMIYSAGSKTISTPAAVLVWINYLAVPDLHTEANGGLRVLVGSGSGAYKEWYVGGSDNYNAGQGGWINVAVDPSLTADNTVGSPTSTLSFFGFTVVCPTNNPSKGNPQALNRFRFGRELQITNGDLANGYATFAGAAAQNDSTSNKWGLFQAKGGGSYLQKGAFVFGQAGTTVDFRDSDAIILIDNTKKVAAGFNEFIVKNASSNVALTRISISALGTVSPGKFTISDNATVALTGCTFTNMGVHAYKSNTTATSSVYNNCAQLELTNSSSTGTLSKCTFNGTSAGTNGAAVNTADLGKISGCTFNAGSTVRHAIIITAPGSYTFSGNKFSGFAATDGSTGTECIYNNSGGSVTINVTGGGDTPTIRNGTSATTTVIAGSVTLSVHVQDAVTGSAIQNARVWVVPTSTASGRLYNQTVTITNSGTTATVSATAHGLVTNDYVWISGASLAANNGTFKVTKIDANSFSYTMTSTPGSNPTGTIKATWAIIGSDPTSGGGLTDSSGNISASYTYGTDTPITGRVRLSSSAPYYQTAGISGTVSSSAGLSVTIQLIKDQ